MSFQLFNKVFIAGARGMVGSAFVRRFQKAGVTQLLTPTRRELDLGDQKNVHQYIGDERPDLIVLAAAKVGGIHANATYPADFIYENLAIATHVIHGAFLAEVPRLLFLGSSCIYPKEAPQPMREECLLTSPLETTNEAYAIAKIAGLKMCAAYRHQYGLQYHSAMPTNLYGPGDNYHAENSHVIPALIRRFHEAMESAAPEVVIWGTGKPRREFLHVDDLADGCFQLLQIPHPPDWVNLGAGSDVSIAELAQMIADVVGFKGRVTQDPSKPDGTMRKLMDTTKMEKMGWRPTTSLKEGLADTYQHFLQELKSGSVRVL